jgi:hypothetical protein
MLSLKSVPDVGQRARPFQIYIKYFNIVFNLIIHTSPMLNLGDTVALATHPYFPGLTDIVFAGDPLQQSPLMIIFEYKEIRPKGTTDNTGKVDPLPHFRCCWYSGKSQSFENAWFAAEEIKLIQSFTAELDYIPAVGANVIFRTATIEIQKKKGSMQYGAGSGTHDSFGVTSMMSFVSPVLTVTGIVNYLKKTKNSAEKKLDIPLIKVKWYNLPADKFSETLLPFTCLAEIPAVDLEKIDVIRKAKTLNHYLRVLIKDKVSIITPMLISSMNGVYFLRYFDIVKGRVSDSVSIDQIKIIDTLEKAYTEKAPTFDFKTSGKPTVSPRDLIKNNLGKMIRIKYANRQEVASVRCVKISHIFEVLEGKETIEYMEGFCFLKDDIRTFRICKVELAEIINL